MQFRPAYIAALFMRLYLRPELFANAVEFLFLMENCINQCASCKRRVNEYTRP